MKYIIYKIINKIDGKVYIGKHITQNINDGYMGSGKHLKNAIKKYGIENFEKEILYIFNSEEDMNSKEAELVTEDFCNRKDTYNICPGGKGGFGYINANNLNLYGYNGQQIENINRLKEYLKKHHMRMKNDSDYRKEYSYIMSIASKKRDLVYGGNFLGKKHKEETKQRIGEANSIHQLGNKNSQYGTMWITNGTENRKIDKKTKIPDGWYKGRKLKIKA